MKIFKSFFSIINYKTLIMAAVSIAASYVCIHYQIKAQFPLYLISIAIVFPIVFSIDSAYKRREHALQFYADLKAHAMSYYLAARDWVSPNAPEKKAEIKKELIDVFRLISENFMKKPEDAKEPEIKIYAAFSKLAKNLEDFRAFGVSAGEVSRMHQYVSKMMISYGIVRNIFFYRTPITLRAYSKIFIYFFPILYGPYSASTYDDFSYPNMAYIIATLYSVILVSLDNLQEHLENPFDQVGEDDINFEVEEMERIMH
jgi:predicted membrane chloride channel (bestrophin family)